MDMSAQLFNDANPALVGLRPSSNATSNQSLSSGSGVRQVSSSDNVTQTKGLIVQKPSVNVVGVATSGNHCLSSAYRVPQVSVQESVAKVKSHPVQEAAGTNGSKAVGNSKSEFKKPSRPKKCRPVVSVRNVPGTLADNSPVVTITPTAVPNVPTAAPEVSVIDAEAELKEVGSDVGDDEEIVLPDEERDLLELGLNDIAADTELEDDEYLSDDEANETNDEMGYDSPEELNCDTSDDSDDGSSDDSDEDGSQAGDENTGTEKETPIQFEMHPVDIGDCGCVFTKPGYKRSVLTYLQYWSYNGGKYECECGLFDHFGIICCHIIKVMVHTGITRIPEAHILKRWTCNARDVVYPNDSILDSDSVGDQLKQSLLYGDALDVVRRANKDKEIHEIVARNIKSAKQEIDRLLEWRSKQPGYKPAAEQADCNTLLAFWLLV